MGEQLRIEELDAHQPKTDSQLLESISRLESVIEAITANLDNDDGSVVRAELIAEGARAGKELEALVGVALERGLYEAEDDDILIDDTKVLMEVA